MRDVAQQNMWQLSDADCIEFSHQNAQLADTKRLVAINHKPLNVYT